MVYRKRISGPGARIRASPEALRLALIRYARKAVEKDGPDNLSARAIATAAHASKTAPYYHFKDGVTEILAAVAIEGFETLMEALERPGVGDPAERLAEMVERYVRFGVDNPNLYRAMFSPRLAEPLGRAKFAGLQGGSGAKTYLELFQQKALALAVLIEPLDRLRNASALQQGKAADFALAVAALAHGLVGEFIDEGIGMKENGENNFSEERRAMTQQVTQMLLSGLLKPSS